MPGIVSRTAQISKGQAAVRDFGGYLGFRPL
jgi:hypothetical protein